MKRRLPAVLVAAGILAVTAAPAFGTQNEGTVSATVTVASPCIEVTPAGLDFGVLPLTTGPKEPSGGVRPVTARNCSGGPATLLARGTSASSPAGKTWALRDASIAGLCSETNTYMTSILTAPGRISLSSEADTTVQSLAVDETAALNAELIMPCTVSGGAGETMTFSYIFTVALR